MLARTRWRPLLPVADHLLEMADQIPLAEPFARTLRSYELLELGADQESEAEHARARPLAKAFGVWLSLLWLDHIEGLRLLRRGQFRSASEVYRGLEERYRNLGVGDPCIVPFGRHAVLAHSRAGRLEDAERVVEWLEQRAGALPCRWPLAAAAAGRASLAVERGDLAEADERYRTAVELLVDASLPLERAEVMIEHGTVLRRHGRPRQGRESFRRAGALAKSGGGEWIARRAGDELAAAGGRRREQRGPNELTPQERRAARLAATGASDKEIAARLAVSVPTVRSHLDHVYAKLGLHSRRELMTMGDRLEAIIGRTGPSDAKRRRRDVRGGSALNAIVEAHHTVGPRELPAEAPGPAVCDRYCPATAVTACALTVSFSALHSLWNAESNSRPAPAVRCRLEVPAVEHCHFLMPSPVP